VIQIPGFRTVLRGYDPTEVDRAIGDLVKARDQARSEAADNALALRRVESDLAQLEEQAAGYRAKLAKLESTAQEAPAPSEIGARIGRMLALAEDEAQAVRTEATTEAEQLLSTARAEAEQLTGNAERYARDVVSKADTEAARILEAARRQSDEIVDYADREAVSRREEAEAIYEAHRVRAAAAVDEFERNVTDRQQQADAEFASRTEMHEQAIVALLDRQESLQAEAEHAAEKARAEADSIIRAAQEEAQQHLDSAHAAAIELRGQAERDLQATISRRNAITAQLATVRRMLADLDAGMSGGSVALGDATVEAAPFAAEGEPRDEPAEPADDVDDAAPSHSETLSDGADTDTENEGMARSGRR
jgi:DivIVA domain-containing protein